METRDESALLDDRMRHLIDQAAEAVASSVDLSDILQKVVARAGHREKDLATSDDGDD